MKSICLAFLAIVMTCALVGTAQAATLTADKDDYSPGEVATLTGTGFQPFEAVDISISIDDPSGGLHIGDYAWTVGQADANGSFVATYTVPWAALDMTLTASAMGYSSSLLATATFTDHGPSPVTSTNFGLAASGSQVTVSVLLGGGSSDVSLTNAVAKIANQTEGGTTDVTLTGPGGNGNGTWSASFDGSCATTYKLNNIVVTWTTTHDHSSTQTPGGLISATTGDCAPPVECPTNSAPAITASDLDLGQLVGCLVGSQFQKYVEFAISDFAPVTSDPDGDPVAVTIDKTSATLIGPGAAEAEVTLTATDDPSGRNVAGCPDLQAMSSSVTVKVKAQIIYDFRGFEPPLSSDFTRIVKNGSTVPVKFRLYDCGGNEICTYLGGYAPTIAVYFSANAVPQSDPETIDAGSSNSDGIAFRYSGTCGVDGNWIYNLKTGSTYGYSTNCTYRITASLDDGTTHDAFISIKK